LSSLVRAEAVGPIVAADDTALGIAGSMACATGAAAAA
jgi:hypothetical protein